jgi:hypothetical protein
MGGRRRGAALGVGCGAGCCAAHPGAQHHQQEGRHQVVQARHAEQRCQVLWGWGAAQAGRPASVGLVGAAAAGRRCRRLVPANRISPGRSRWAGPAADPGLGPAGRAADAGVQRASLRHGGAADRAAVAIAVDRPRGRRGHARGTCAAEGWSSANLPAPRSHPCPRWPLAPDPTNTLPEHSRQRLSSAAAPSPSTLRCARPLPKAGALRCSTAARMAGCGCWAL